MTGIDQDTFNTLKERMKAKFPILLEGYLRDSSSYLSTIEENLANGQIAAIIEASHSLKSASGLLGLVKVHESAKTVEYTAKDMQENQNTDMQSLSPGVQELLAAYNEVSGKLKDELTKLKQA